MNHLIKTAALVGAAIVAVGAVDSASAQQSFRNTSAAQPSPGVVLFRQTAEYTRWRRDPTDLDRKVDEYRLNTQLAFGITREVAIIGQLPLYHRHTKVGADDTSSTDFHFGDANVLLKWRIWQYDSGPLDTMRLSLIGGLDIPIGKDPFGNAGWDPSIGAVFTSIQGKHGVNAALTYKFNTHERKDVQPVGPGATRADQVNLDGAYLYRFHPDAFDADTHGAWYVMAELNAVYETNGDIEVLFSPGIMYEARRWVIEASVQFPVYQDIDKRMKTDVSVGIGWRILF